jgi:LysM repeat protein
MKKLLKLGIVVNQKIRFSGKKRAILLFLLFTWGIPALACTRSVKYPDDPATSFPISTLPATQTVEIPPETTANPVITTDPVTPTVDLTTSPTPAPPVLYYTQAGDTLPVLSVRFNVNPDEISSPEVLPATSLLKPNLLLIIPSRLGNTTPADLLFPDSEIVYSPSAINFDIDAFVNEAGGYLSTYTQWVSNKTLSGAQVIEKVAIENSINPRMLLALLEYQSNWVYGQPANMAQAEYPMGYIDHAYKDLYQQLAWAVQQLSIGYYGWRAGLLTELCFSNGETLRLAPNLNAGTVAIQYMFSKLYYSQQWAGNLYSPDGLTALHERMFGNYWVRAQTVEPLYPTDLSQPELELPFYAGMIWSLTGGPHSAWGKDGALSALDFAPAANENGCVESLEWVTASAPGIITRSENGVVVLDLDGDGNEQTGWAIMYLHIATNDRVAAGTKLPLEGKIGHPSCEGGLATGTHVHMARKYNGEWILADGPMPFVLSGWTAHNGLASYKGNLTKGDMIVTASTVGSYESRISR